MSGSASFQRGIFAAQERRTMAASASAPSEVFACKALAQITSRRAKCGMKGYRRCLPELAFDGTMRSADPLGLNPQVPPIAFRSCTRQVGTVP